MPYNQFGGDFLNNPFGLSEEEKQRQQAKLLRGGYFGGQANPYQTAPEEGVLSPAFQGGEKITEGQLRGVDQLAIDRLRNEQSPEMQSLMKTRAVDPWSAVAQTLGAGYLGHIGRKGSEERAGALEQTMKGERKREQELDRMEVFRETEKDRLTESRAAAREGRDVTEFGERGVQNDEWLFKATRPDLIPGTDEYGKAFAQFLEEDATRYGRGYGSGGRPAAALQEYQKWLEINPNATEKQKQKMFDRLVSSFKTTDVGDVDYFLTDPETTALGGAPDDDLSAEGIRDATVKQEGAKAGAKEAEKLSANAFASAQEKLNMMGDEIGLLEEKILDEDFDGAVGLIDAYTGSISEDFAYFGDEGKLGKTMQMIASNMVLRQAEFLKGNLSVKELGLLLKSVPDRGTDESTWKTWFKDYKDAFEIAKRRQYDRMSQGGSPSVPYDPNQVRVPGEDDEGIIYLN